MQDKLNSRKVKEVELNGKPIKIRDITIYQAISMQQHMTDGSFDDMDPKTAEKVADLISDCMVEPAMTPDEALATAPEAFKDLFITILNGETIADSGDGEAGNESEPESVET